MAVRMLLLTVASVLLCGCSPPVDLAPIRQAEHGREADSPVLKEALANGSAEEKVAAAVAMGRIQSPAYADPLARALDDPDLAVRDAAIFALGQFGMVENAPGMAATMVKELLRGDDVTALPLAVEALGKLAPPDGPDWLAPFLSHDSARVREEAAHGMMRWRFTPVWRGEAEQPAEWPDEASASLARLLNDPEAPVRIAASHAFSRYGDPRALVTLAGVAGDREPLVRLFAIRGVGRSGVAGAAHTIAWGQSDADAGVRAETVQALATLERQDLLTRNLLTDPSFHVRAALARALGTAKGKATLAMLKQLETDRSPTVKAAAIGAVSARLGAGYRMLLQEHLKDARWPVRAAAAAAGGLPSAVEDPDPRVAAAALSGMAGKLDDPEVAAAVRKALSSGDLAVRGTAAGLLADWPHADQVDLLLAVLADSPGVRWLELRTRVRELLADLEEEVPEEQSSGESRETPLREFDSHPVVILETSKGVMEIECFPEDAPVHVANFLNRVEAGLYDGLIWHRVVSNFVVQGGDPEGNGWGGPGYTLPDEINRRRYGTGTVGMPKLGKDTGGCQLFITHIPTPHLDGNYTVFGQVVAGREVIDRIEVGDTIVRATVR